MAVTASDADAERAIAAVRAELGVVYPGEEPQ